MVTIKKLPKSKFLEYYANDELSEVINVLWNGEQRIYGKTRIHAADEESGFFVVYCVLSSPMKAEEPKPESKSLGEKVKDWFK